MPNSEVLCIFALWNIHWYG